MHESAIEGVKGQELNGCDAIRESRISRIVVEGYDTSLPREDVEKALRNHFASCGNIIHVYVPINDESDIPNRFSFIYVNGEDEEKALRLNGSDMGGGILQIYAYPFHENYLDDVLATMKEGPGHRLQRTLEVTGYDPSLSMDDVESKMCKHFSPASAFAYRTCGGLKSTALVYVIGEDAVQMALELSGRSVDGMNIVVTQVLPRKPIKCGYYTNPYGLARQKNKTTEYKTLSSWGTRRHALLCY
ncbi:PREDICTED: uncharacterized protein LOC106310008 [Brassica oleracea var. oleracea]|uniref:RRM domain-containing protein n=1 Tax=Brassica oleracea var. oleracea TaxID=109376 RepID=A0A0D3DXJ8_BRAOL|nr:PREDICTED: uncharacterized protein LOC106310008 [Brassica oleracea var. oleracea]